VETDFAPRVRLVRLAKNLGFAGGNNAGARLATAEWLALINNDAIADPRWIERLLAAATDADGLVACRILRARDRDRLENTGVALWWDGMSRGMNHLKKDAETRALPPLIPSGCAMMVRRRAFDEAGGFDESFFAYSEDTDLGLKVRLRGYGCAFANDAVVHHHGAATLGVVSPEKIYLVERNRMKVLFRYFPLGLIVASPLFTAFRYLLLAARVRGRGAQSGSFSALARAWRDGLAGMPHDLALRRRLLAGKAGEMKFWLRRHRLDLASLTALGES
jgi:GT2 family glycosyltransferase